MSALARLEVAVRHCEPDQASSEAQTQTRDAFCFKWSKRDTYESPAVQDASRQWLFDRYCDGNPARLEEWLAEGGGRKLILDAGCGAGHSALLFFGEHLRDHDYLGIDISDAVTVARQRFEEYGYPGDFLRCSLMEVPAPAGSFDLVFAEGVLHHTDDPARAFEALAQLVKPGGRFLFYVYAKKGPIREFTDDYIRATLREMSNEEAWNVLEPLTQLGVALARLGTTIDVPQDIPLLGIHKGPVDLQRFFYWNVCKMFYREDWAIEEMNHVNFDWFRPANCHRQSPETVEAWVGKSGLVLERIRTEPAGITVVARKPR